MMRDVRYRRGRFVDPRAREVVAARWFEVLDASSREFRILEGFIFEGQTAKAISSELHISRRQFYYLYSRLIERLQEIRERVPASVLPAVSKDEASIEHARSLLAMGHTLQAADSLARVLNQRPGERIAISAMLQLSRAYADRAEFWRARDILDRATRLLSEIDPGSRARTLRGFQMARSYVAYAGGFYADALVLAEEAMGEYPHVGYTLPQSDMRQMARDLIYVATLHQERGGGGRAMEHLFQSVSLLQRLAVPSAAEHAQAYAQMAVTATSFPSMLSKSISYAEEALRVAHWHGLHYEQAWGYIALALAKLVNAAPDQAIAAGRAALTVARATCRGDPMARILFVNTRLYTSSGSPGPALALLREAEPHVAPASLLEGILQICRARTRHALGHGEAAMIAADRAIATMEARFPSHYVGVAYWTRGSERLKRGLPGSALDAERAVFYLEDGTLLQDYSNALEFSAVATANKRHARLAREVRAALGG